MTDLRSFLVITSAGSVNCIRLNGSGSDLDIFLLGSLRLRIRFKSSFKQKKVK